MKHVLLPSLLAVLTSAGAVLAAPTNAASGQLRLIRPVAPGEVRWTDGFWRQKLEAVRTGTLLRMAAAFQSGTTSHLKNFRIAEGQEQGAWTGSFAQDGEVYQWIEAAADCYAATKDPTLGCGMDELIGVIAQAQAADGYLCTAVQAGSGEARADCASAAFGPFRGAKRFTSPKYAELENLGYLFSAAAAHHAATGKTNLLHIAVRAANLVSAELAKSPASLTFSPRVPAIVSGAMDLYQATGDERYLAMAREFVDRRGVVKQADYGTLLHAATADFVDVKDSLSGTDQFQQRTPVRDEREAVGNTVSAHELYAGAAAVYGATGDRSLGLALEKIWENAAKRKRNVAGGTGPVFRGVSNPGYKSWGDKISQAYGADYELPNAEAFYGTCGNAGFAFWNGRMFANTGDGRYLDTLELVAANAVLAGMNLDGTAFSTTNPLRRDVPPIGTADPVGLRQELPAASCCAMSVARVLAKLATWAYGVSPEGVWVNLYGDNRLETHLADGTGLSLTQRADYPWNGDVTLTLGLTRETEFDLFLRVPGWCRASEVQATVNGRLLADKSVTAGYLKISRAWAAGDVVSIKLPMPIELLAGHPQVEEIRGRGAVKRGPLVYCVEGGDLPVGTRVEQVSLSRRAKFRDAFEPGLLGGVAVLEGRVQIEQSRDWNGKLYREWEQPKRREATVRFVPYFAWNNRGIADMAVWLRLAD